MSIRKIVYIGLFTGLMIVLTSIIAIPIGVNGYINLSDLLIMLLSTYLDDFSIFIISGIGCAFSDIFLGYSNYAIFTLLIKGLEGLFMVYLFRKKMINNHIIIFISGGLIMLTGYGLVDILLFNDIKMFIPSIILNLPQALSCILMASLLFKPFKLIGRKIDESKEY